MVKKRLISVLVMHDNWIVQSFGFQRYLPIGRPGISVEFMKNWDIDEIVLLDITATRDGKKPNLEMVSEISRNCFVPLTVGGGITDIQDIRMLIRAGADKISINKQALYNPEFIAKSSAVFGSQCVVVSMDVGRNTNGEYEVYSDMGKGPTGKHPTNWAREVEKLGAGEILLNSIERDGSRSGYDLELAKLVAKAVRIPVILCGGVGKMSHFVEGVLQGGASAVAAANIFQHIEHSTIVAKACLKKNHVDVRLNTPANYEAFDFDEKGRLLKRSDEDLENIWFEKHLLETL